MKQLKANKRQIPLLYMQILKQIITMILPLFCYMYIAR